MEYKMNHIEETAELLRGGFAPVVILLREFDFIKSGIVLDGLPYSAWSLLEHMRRRQVQLLAFMKDPAGNANIWPEAYWPDSAVPENEGTWKEAIDTFERELEEMICLVLDENTPLFELQETGKSLFWAALANMQHNSYHIGQIKAIGRQLGVW